MSASAATVSEIVTQWKAEFDNNGVPDAEQSIRTIVAHVLALKHVPEVTQHLNEKFSKEQNDQLQSFCESRLKRMPLQYILKEWKFRDFYLYMRPPVFIPWPETEMLIDVILQNLPNPESRKSFIEVGCGSGAISLGLLKALPKITCTAVDLNPLACKLTLDNAKRLGVDNRIQVFENVLDKEGNLRDPLPFDKTDLFVSNPPYMPSHEVKEFPPETQLYEDLRCLEGGKDGTQFVKAVICLANKILIPDGDLFMEIHPTHPDILLKWLNDHNDLKLSHVKTFKDFANKNRYIYFKKL